jgi:Na+/H+ antiporter NhaA
VTGPERLRTASARSGFVESMLGPFRAAGRVTLPAGVGWRALYAVSWLGGIGFTRALFVAALAFGDTPLDESAKAGVLVASGIGGVSGYALLYASVIRTAR